MQGGELDISGNASYDLPNNNDFEGISAVRRSTSPTGAVIRTPTSTGNIRYNDTNGLVIGGLSASGTASTIDVTAGATGGTLEVAGSISAGSTVRLATSSTAPIELSKAAASAAAFQITAGTSISLSTQGSGTITNTGTGQSLVLSAPTIINLQTESGSIGAIGSGRYEYHWG